MADSGQKHRPPKRNAVPLSALVGRIIAPVSAKRGFATADLVASWPEVVGTQTAECTRPERIAWPRDGTDGGGVLHVSVEGPRAVLIQHQLSQIIERVNSFLGYRAVERIRLRQAPVASTAAATPEERPLVSEDEAKLTAAVAGVESDALQGALGRLGRGVLSRR